MLIRHLALVLAAAGDWAEMEVDSRADASGKGVGGAASIWLSYLKSYQVGGQRYQLRHAMPGSKPSLGLPSWHPFCRLGARQATPLTLPPTSWHLLHNSCHAEHGQGQGAVQIGLHL